MHNVLFSVVCIKRGDTRIYTSKYVSRDNDVDARRR